MPVATIRFFPDPILRKKAQPVRIFNASLFAVLKTLRATMRSQPSGIGIAAPQIGISKQIACVDVSSRVAGGRPLALVNPVLLHGSHEMTSREGCMSLPDYTAFLKRFGRVRIRYQDLTGFWVDYEAQGIEAVCIQHEMDHLAGLLFLDRVTCLKTDMMPRKPSKRA